MVKSHGSNMDTSTGVAGWYIVPPELCNKLIEYYEASDRKIPGTFGKRCLDTSLKDSTDLPISAKEVSESEVLQEYVHLVISAVHKFKELYPAVEDTEAWYYYPEFNMKKYVPGGGYHRWHHEWGPSETGSQVDNGRHLNVITYLNTVEEGGETEFLHQKMKVKPEEGLTVIFGTNWFHQHRGLTTAHEDKYIISSWFGFNRQHME